MSTSMFILSAAMAAAFSAEPRFATLETQEPVISYAPRNIVVVATHQENKTEATLKEPVAVEVVTALDEDEEILDPKPSPIAPSVPAIAPQATVKAKEAKPLKAKPAQKKKKRVAVACPK